MITFEIESTVFHKPIYVICARGYFKNVNTTEYRLATLNPQEIPRYCGFDFEPRTFYFRATFIVEQTVQPIKFLPFIKYKKRSYIHFIINSFQNNYYFNYRIPDQHEIICGEFIAEYTLTPESYTKYLFDKQLNDIIEDDDI